MTTSGRVEFFALAVLYTLLPALAVGGALGVPVLLCLAAAPAAFGAGPRIFARKRPAALLAILLVTGWVALSTTWSPLPGDDQGLRLAALVPLGLLFAAAGASPRNAALVRAGAIAGVIVLGVLLAIEAIWTLPFNRAAQPETSLFELNRNTSRGAVVLLALSWAAQAALLSTGKPGLRVLAAAILLICGVLSFQFGQSANVIAFVLAAMFFVAGYWLPVIATRAVTLGLVVWMLAAPFAVQLLAASGLTRVLPFSWAHRVEMWGYVAGRVFEQPIWGHGLEGARAIDERIVVQGSSVSAVSAHPHSISLQFWYETGAVGVLLACVAVGLGGWWLSRAFASNRYGAAAACATLAFLGFIANVSYGAWAEWQIALFFIAASAVGALRIR